MRKVSFILLLVCLFLFGAVILAIVLDQNLNKITGWDVGLDVIFVSKGRNRLREQYTLWKQAWKSRQSTRFFVFSQNPLDPIDEDMSVVVSSESEEYLFTHAQDLLPDTQGRHFLWASDNVIPMRYVGARMFQLEGEFRHPLVRFFGGLKTDALLMDVHDQFESWNFPVTLMSYAEVGHREFVDVRLQIMNAHEYIYSSRAHMVLLKHESDRSILEHPIYTSLFQIVHISPQASDPNLLNSYVQTFWQNWTLK
jgi:hypothetical protein